MTASAPLPATARLSNLLWACAAIALTSGFAEATVAVYRNRVRHLPIGQYVAGEVFWMTPLAALVALGLVVALWLGVSALVPTQWGLRRWAVALAAGVATYGLVTAMSLGLGTWSKVIFGAGVAVAAQRLFDGWPAVIGRIARATSLGLAATALLTAIVVPWRRHAREAAALPTAPAPAGSPNIVVLIWDTARAQNMSLYGYARRTTPVLDSLGARGLVFEHAFATSPWSLPSHASIFTGLYPDRLSVGSGIPLDTVPPTIAEFFSARGYATASMTANLFYGSPDYGIDRGFATYDARPPIHAPVIAHTWELLGRNVFNVGVMLGRHHTLLRRRATHVNASFLSWLDRRGDRPFFAVLNYFDAHEPYAAPAPFDTAFAPRGTRYWADETLRSAPSAVLNQLRDMYDGGIAYDDHSLGELVAALRARGLADNTVLVVTSDHGEEFGERGPTFLGHNRSLYRVSLQVPLVVVDPRNPGLMGRRRDIVSIRDIPATVADLAFPGVAHGFEGTSLNQLATLPDSVTMGDSTRAAIVDKHRWASEKNDYWPTAWGPMYSVISPRQHYIIDARGGEALYDLGTDPFEAHNLASADSAGLQWHRRRLDEYVGPVGVRVPRKGAKPLPPPSAAGR
ncbi:MAG: sulfatase-like hydrolase/transferase [Gemmatimonadaceae bacterium]|nr:sulfatase-like hydrolase/transferase [Gemmatimonadaceae bacterium]